MSFHNDIKTLWNRNSYPIPLNVMAIIQNRSYIVISDYGPYIRLMDRDGSIGQILKDHCSISNDRYYCSNNIMYNNCNYRTPIDDYVYENIRPVVFSGDRFIYY